MALFIIMNEQYANIIVDISVDKLDRTFQYRIPEELKGRVFEGCRVKIPFGLGNTVREGYVYSLENEPRIAPEKIKDILEYVPGAVTVEGRLFALAAWLRQTYGSTMNQALKTVLPVRKMRKRVPKKKTEPAAAARQADESITGDRQRTDAGAASALREADNGAAKAPLQPDFASCGLRRYPQDDLPPLNELQQHVYDGILNEWNDTNRPCLIHGITGSGKTFIYIHLIKKIIEEGRQAILLIPEISLTWQTVGRFYACFKERVGVLNSRLSAGEKADLIQKVKEKQVDLVIGPRSALFTPFENLGIIIIDEEHENSYQSEVTPRYHARETAIERARLEGAHVVFGSATPSVDSVYACRLGRYALFKLENRFGSAHLPEVIVADMREEMRSGNRTMLSRTLTDAMAERLEKKEQIMLFLNRRGYSGFISCRSCGTVVKCPHCDVSLTQHNNGRLICHYCGYSEPMIHVCKNCGSPFIGGLSAGTQQVEEAVLRVFPEAKIQRMDADTTKRKGSFERILKNFADHKSDILIGTQMIVKGHDFPNVTLVGVLAADMSLYASDYRSSERTYQLISQAVGRAGRGEKKGLAVIQTYDPEHFSIVSAVAGDSESFYNEEIADRELLLYPPAGHMIAVHGSAQDEQALYTAMEYLKRYAMSLNRDNRTQVFGPAPETVSKVADVYRAALYIRGGRTDTLIRMRRSLEKYIEINNGFDDITIQFNLDS